MALIAGIQAPSGRVMGHAGAFVDAGEKKAAGKVRALEDAGVVTTNHPSNFGEEMKRLLGIEKYRKSSVSASGTDTEGSRYFEADSASNQYHTTMSNNETCTL